MSRRLNLDRRTRNSFQVVASRSRESSQDITHRNENNRLRTARSRSNQRNNGATTTANERRDIQNLQGVAFAYSNITNHASHRQIKIGPMNDRCRHCQALKFKGEADGMCCASGKVKLPELGSPTQPLSTLLNGLTPESNHFLNNIRKYNSSFFFFFSFFNHFLNNIRKYNSSFQMTSFGATNIIRDNFMQTFKIQGQIYHRAGSLLPFDNADHQFLQLYFIGNAEDEADRRCAIITNTRRQIIFDLQNMFHEHNELVQVFKTSLDRMPSDDHKIFIRSDKTPVGEHARRFNAQIVDEVAIVIVGEQFNNRDIVLHRRNEQLERVSETHRSYDALQYPILFWSGQDGYNFNIKMINPVNGREGTKKVSAMNYYAYSLQIRQNQDNHILRCRALFHQYIVDMYAKIESERLNFLRFNQAKLRSEEYVHLPLPLT
ncbi:uncharacterized protein LOC121404970 isoform X1 [Drosophila obscura]|uniref:uncharacterized protein LOC121404970 isoform X1 n=1 Tax=Drosophila obscura TaxID=7282 RepID=UPI001BB143A7|nr:uncharacterized protein LOC121404970 isoform X1 [Drosophila obscura]XP_041451343.1 uncharacterized protein LOC121404970 isoform X1 [Drosophila obscura]